MLLTDVWRTARVNEQPYRWLATEPGDLLDPATVPTLLDEMPSGSFQRRESAAGSDKSYRNHSRQLVEPDGTVTGDLSPCWRELVGELCGIGYRRAVADVLDQAVAPSVEIRLVRHAPGDWLGPHTDRADKVFSHILYLNPDWRAEWGGCLQILASSDPADVLATITPRLGASALLARADNSWHQVTPVVADQPRGRVSLLVHGRTE
jgi:hypothetical protein